jgi:uncharacterized membrane protein
VSLKDRVEPFGSRKGAVRMSRAMIVAWIQGWCPWCGHHMAGGGWGMMFGWSLILLILILVILLAFRRNGVGGGEARIRKEDPAETALREEYARGAIDGETYRRRLQELRRD